ncbi:MAG: LrgB family protein [Hungatella sp.]|nr:LrgB family protein [Hungatella sp.]
MNQLFAVSVFFGVFITLAAYEVGSAIKRRFKKSVFNPLLIAIILVILFLRLFDIEYSVYQEGAEVISFLLTPATICLAVPLYEQLELLKKNLKAVLAGIISGVLTSLGSILVLALLFRLDHAAYVTLLPKSITTAIGMGVSQELGGYVSITVAVIIVTGVLGNMLAETVCRIFKIQDPIARGIAIGTSSHAIGTAKAMEMGEVEGAMSSLSIVVSGILTVICANGFAQFV